MAFRAGGNGSAWDSVACLQRGNVSWNASLQGACGNDTALARPLPARQKEMDSFRIVLYVLIFLLSVAGNLMIVVVLAVNRRMRTVTNCFLLSLALSDLMLAIFCMPFTLIPNILKDFVFGAAMCKIVAYLMGISVSISTFSLVAIAIERYSAICNPLKSRAWQTRSHALPRDRRHLGRELYRGMQFELNNNPETAALKNGGAGNHDDSDGCYIQKKPAAAAGGVELPTLSGAAAAAATQRDRARANASESKWRAKKRVIRMLTVIVAMFFVCWMPLYCVNTWKAFDLLSAHRALSGAPISFIHLLSYTSACVNPVIYCFMNMRFRAALLATCGRCCCCCFCPPYGRDAARRRAGHPRGRGAGGGDDGYTTTTTAAGPGTLGGGATGVSRVSYSAVSTDAGP
ncbi:hypothetical protein CRUP_001386 [Coryphaenoides rupestris]|nr:hypothetical protein CRUP_001386 [Coryphaenoides rupestris]